MLSSASSQKIAKLLPMLASDQDGEVAGAARAIGRALAADNLDFHDLVRILVGRASHEQRPSENGDPKPGFHDTGAPDEPTQDRRFETRFRKVLQAGKILLPNGGILDCRLRNRSVNGALLELASLIDVPDQFVLRIPSTHEAFGVRIIWRGNRRIGVLRL